MASTTKFDFITITTAGWNSEFTDNLKILEAGLVSRRTGVLAETVEQYDAAALDISTGLWKKAYSYNGAHIHSPCMGIFLSGGNAGSTVVIQTEGEISNPDWALKPGWPVMMGYNPGSVRCAALAHNNQVIGYAVDATTIYLESNLKFYNLETTTTPHIGGWLTSWLYRKKVTLSRPSGAVTNYQMKILVGESSGATGEDVHCDGKCLTTFDDLRFTAADGTTILDYWIESITGTTPNQLATVWVEFNSIGTSSTAFYMYYGNISATPVSNGANTFIFFDDFERGNDEDAVGGGWTDVGGTAKIDTAQKYNGTRSVRCYNTSGIWKTITPSENIAIAVRAYKGDAEGVTFRFEWSATERVVIKWEASDEGIYYIPDTTWLTLNATASHSNWHKFEFTNFNSVALTYDVWLDDTKVGNDLQMQSATDLTEGQLWLYGRTDSEYSWYDTVYVRNWRDTEPAWGAWYGEECETVVWLNCDWNHRKQFFYSRADGEVADMQVKIMIGESAGSTGYDIHCEGQCDSAFDDLRFTNASGDTLLPYWIESVSGTTPNQTATVWVKLDRVAEGPTVFYMYYGNILVSAASNGPDTFVLFDEFEWGVENDPVSNSGGSVTWTTGTAGPTITLAQHSSGTRSVKVPYNSTSFRTDVVADGTESIRCKYFKSNATSNWTYIYHGNGTKAMCVEIKYDEGIYCYTGIADQSTGYSITADAWNTLEFNNFNFASGTFDIWLNGSKIVTGAPMFTSSAASGRVSFVGPDLNTGSVYVDDFLVRKWSSTAPALGTIGSDEEAPSTTTTTTSSTTTTTTTTTSSTTTTT